MFRSDASRSGPRDAEPRPERARSRSLELVDDHLPVARRIAARLKRQYPWVDAEDLYGYASLGLTLAAHAYQPDHRVPFSRFAFSKGTFLAVDEMRKNRILRRGDRKSTPYVYSSSRAWADTKSPADDPIDADWEKAWKQMEAKDHCESLLRGMRRGDRRILMMHYGEGLTFREIGDILDLSESAASLRHAAAMRRLRRLLRTRTGG